MAHYLDTSALVKLVVAEPETAALRAWVEGADGPLVASDLTRTELMRVVRRVVPDRALLARQVLDALTVIEMTTSIFAVAGRLEPLALRSLDALHLAAALDLGDDLDALVTYDVRLAAAAASNGLAAVAPS